MNTSLSAIGVLACLLISTVSANDKVIRIYHDSDYTSHSSSAQAMKMGFLTALDEIDYKIGNYQLEFVEKDHRGNVVRSHRTMKQFVNDPSALFILGGLHSPPYIKYRQYINDNEILLLVPWAAGGPITRHPDSNNWVFRLSVDDTKAGLRISDYAVNSKQCKSPHLLLEDTGWGKSNFKTITNYFESSLSITPEVTWFNWNTKDNAAKLILREIAKSDSDCVIFVGNAIEGATFMTAMTEVEQFNLPVLSHWGITGGNFPQKLGPTTLSKLDLSFIQSCFSFVSSEESKFSQSVFARGQKLFPEALTDYRSLKSPTGYTHAYDLAKVAIQAMQNITLSDDMAQNRQLLREELESLNTPVKGLIKTYQKPYSTFSQSNLDAHEALGLSDLCMAKFTPDGVIEVMPNTSPKVPN
ncbi:ABC transporter substrate-binding protein [Neptuniibacter sp. QD72_48]|uniref:ABC transporter substrate-binding protein n=1 Tax=Neptuniibacter sp. QD72_48 TaxID=3398214 RepID=UPI0039F64422